MTPDEILARSQRIGERRRERSQRFRLVRDAATNGDWDEFESLLNAEYAAAQMGDSAGEAASPGENDRGGVSSPGNES